VHCVVVPFLLNAVVIHVVSIAQKEHGVSLASRYLNQTVALRSVVSYNRDGEPIYSDTPIPARVEGERRLVRDESGAQVVSETRVFTDEEVRAGDFLILPGGSQREVISASPKAGLSGRVDHYEIAL